MVEQLWHCTSDARERKGGEKGTIVTGLLSRKGAEGITTQFIAAVPYAPETILVLVKHSKYFLVLLANSPRVRKADTLDFKKCGECQHHSSISTGRTQRKGCEDRKQGA